MKRILLIALMLIMARVVCCQEVVQYPYHCYMEWPMPMPMDSMYNYEMNNPAHQWCAYTAVLQEQNYTAAREFVVDTPTTIYGIALTLWGQDTARRDVSVTLMTRQKREVTRIKEVRWFDSMPFRYVVFESSGCSFREVYYRDTAKAYEFYFDQPVIVSDTFLVGFQTLGIDGQQHEHQDYNIDSAGYVYFVSKHTTCNVNYPHPVWYFIRDNLTGNPFNYYWAGILPIIEEPPCNPDTLSCPVVEELLARPMDSLNVEFIWPSLPQQQYFQVSVCRPGTPPDAGTIYNADSSPLVVTDRWDTTATYVAYIRTQRHRHCHPNDTLVWSDWIGPVTFFGHQPSDPTGIATADRAPQLFTLTPNPAKKRVRVHSDYALKSVEVFDAQGRKALSATAEGNVIELDVSQWPSGSYVVRVHTLHGTASKRLVVED